MIPILLSGDLTQEQVAAIFNSAGYMLVGSQRGLEARKVPARDAFLPEDDDGAREYAETQQPEAL